MRIAVVLPESCRFGIQRIHHHHKLQLGEGFGNAVGIGERALRIKTLHQQAVHLALIHQFDHLHNVVHFVPLRQPVVAPVVFFGGVVAVHPFQEAHKESGGIAPVIQLAGLQRFRGLFFQIVGKGRMALFIRQHQITGQHGREQPQIRQALNIGVTAQGVHAAARHADIAQQ